MTKRNYTEPEETGLVGGDNTDNPKLMYRVLADGKTSLFLNYYFGYQKVKDEKTGKTKIKHFRKKETLKLYIYTNPLNTEERQYNKKVLMLAKKIRFEKEQELLENKEGYRLQSDFKINFYDYFQHYIDEWKTEKSTRPLTLALKLFREFITTNLRYSQFETELEPSQITPEMMKDFANFLQDNCEGSGPATHYKRFRKVIKYAFDNGVIKRNPCEHITVREETGKVKDFLSPAEIQRLAKTHYLGENNNIRRAFLFCCLTGLRWCDVSELKYYNIDYSNKLFRFTQMKTGKELVLPLNDTLLALIEEPKTAQPKKELVFPLPSYNMCIKALRHWTERAHIFKHITWHCARHSFATQLISNGVQELTTARLLGHSSLKYIGVYARMLDEDKRKALDTLPNLDLGLEK